MRPGVARKRLQAMPWTLLELHLQRVVVRVVVIECHIQARNIRIATHRRLQQFIPQQIHSLIGDVADLKAAGMAKVLLQAAVPHINFWIFR